MKGRIMTGKRTGVIKIPRTALLTWDVPAKKAEIFVVKEDIAQSPDRPHREYLRRSGGDHIRFRLPGSR